jgi:hypothetical protein
VREEAAASSARDEREEGEQYVIVKREYPDAGYPV